MKTETAHFEISDNGPGTLVLNLSGNLDSAAYYSLASPLTKIVSRQRPKSLDLDLSKVEMLDDFGALLLADIHRAASKIKGACSIKKANASIQEILDLLHFQALISESAIEGRKPENPVSALGGAVLAQARSATELISFTGEVIFSLSFLIMHPSSMRWDDTVLAMRKVGVDAVPIVGVINLLLGFILAFMTSVQLKQFGANNLVPPLVAIAMVRELGPIMTAIVFTGRSGSAFASEIGTMKISEEIDALSTMGFNPVAFLVIPKMAASLVVVPILTVFACLFGILGGLIVGVLFLDLTLTNYMHETINSLNMYSVRWCFFKAAVFSVVITWISCLRGFQVRGGATAVGEATTSAVVSGIFLIVLWNCMFAFIQLYWG